MGSRWGHASCEDLLAEMASEGARGWGPVARVLYWPKRVLHAKHASDRARRNCEAGIAVHLGAMARSTASDNAHARETSLSWAWPA